MSNQPLDIVLLGKQHDRLSFSCGIPELDKYIKEQVSQDMKRMVAKVYVAAVENKVIGFFTLSASSISIEHLPTDIAKKLPKYTIPATLIGRLAVDHSFQRKGVGEALMIDAIKRTRIIGSAIGVHSLVVDAKNDTAKSFYKHFGFKELANLDMRLFLPLHTISNLLQP